MRYARYKDIEVKKKIKRRREDKHDKKIKK